MMQLEQDEAFESSGYLGGDPSRNSLHVGMTTTKSITVFEDFAPALLYTLPVEHAQVVPLVDRF